MLVETLVAAVLMIVVISGAFAMLEITLKTSATTRAREGATNLARQIIEDARTIPYGQISPTSIVGQLQALNGLADASPAPGWQVIRRGYTYTVTVSECSIDDPKDGYGVHDNTFCADSSTQGTADPQPANLKRLTVDVAWTVGTTTRDVQQVQTLTSTGQAIGPAASGLQLSQPTVSTPTAPVITDATVSQLTFTVTALASATAVNWTLDGSNQVPAPTVSGTTWTFSWAVTGLSDGVYQVGAQAVDAKGVAGPPVSMNVTLIRSVPAAPRAITGGFNTVNVSGTPTQSAELQWQANSERNVIGYRVYNPSARLVCPGSLTVRALTPSCIDLSPPLPSSTNLTYSVVALYRDSQGAVQEGAAGTFALAPTVSPPNAPSMLTATAQADGTVALSWSAPSGGAPVAFYRIYKDGTDYTKRYDYTGAATPTTYLDASAFASVHNYYVTAVNATLAESPILGPAHP